MIIHQKLSRVIAKEIFKVENEEILNAICCHTTLRKHATKMDLVLFVADKIEWDQNGTPPYLIEIKKRIGKIFGKSSFCIYFIFVGKERYIESYTSVARRSILGFKREFYSRKDKEMQLKEYMNQTFPGVTLGPYLYSQWEIIYILISEKDKYQIVEGTDDLNMEYFSQLYTYNKFLFEDIFSKRRCSVCSDKCL